MLSFNEEKFVKQQKCSMYNKTPKVVSVGCVGLWKHRLSQSRSHGFLVWCGRTRHERRAFARSLRFALTVALRAQKLDL